MTQRPRLATAPLALATTAWDDYALLDSGHGRKLERYGPFTAVRPEPQCLWSPRLPAPRWDMADAVFDPAAAQDDEDAGRWRFSGAPPAPEGFPLGWGEARFTARFTSFRHLAFFPEQAANWAWLDAAVRAAADAGREPPRVLNLFGYTGVASLVCAAAGAHVTHVDASKKSVTYARENATLSRLDHAPVRWLVEDARKYVARELKRGQRYEGVILDPPKYGRGPTGEVWRLFEDLPALIADCAALLSDRARFLLLNAYAARISGAALGNTLVDALDGRGGQVDWGELVLVEDQPDPRAIGLSFFARWRA
ncbi:MAG: class I SAM-dependent methyltransferase [Caulobacteraceae bacterium]|nr:class I SAM-dependent methyltransferase [Caulobacter sp.]